jgi:hypothetical protein
MGVTLNLKTKSLVPGFVHKTLSNGLTVSTCQGCMKSIGSPTPTSLRMAEENHTLRCRVGFVR